MRPGGNGTNGAARCERKFFVERVDRREVEELVRTHPGFFREVYQSRFVNNIYLDSPGRSSYYDHLDGVGERSKLRIRWYGGFLGLVEHPVLELKTKQGMVGCKRLCPLPPFLFDSAFDFVALLEDGFASGLPGGLCGRLCCAVPSLINRYRRTYYRSADGVFRLTVDDDLSFGAPRRAADPELHSLPDRGSTIVEVKYDPADDDRADRILSAFPFRVCRRSKYCVGIEALQALGI